MKKGFTLIELLVVVLIIGILAAVALPKFELAVERARAVKAIIAVKALAEATERYYLANGSYPENTQGKQLLEDINAELDIEVSAPKDFQIFKHFNIYIGAERVNSSRFHYAISKTMTHGNHATWSKRGLTCHTSVLNDTSRSAQLCKQICRTDRLVQTWGSASSGCEFQ